MKELFLRLPYANQNPGKDPVNVNPNPFRKLLHIGVDGNQNRLKINTENFEDGGEIWNFPWSALGRTLIILPRP